MDAHCNHCSFDNPPGMRFCGNCGARLAEAPAAAEAGPGLPSDPDQSQAADLTPAGYSPEDLGVLIGADLLERLQRAGVESAGQRREVTVLFTDLTGYTALAERIDGEDLYEVVQQYIRLLVNDVYRYGGVVDKLTGDGLMALFGAPVAYENNAERAVRAALDMQADVSRLSSELKDRLGFGLSMRVGLHGGSVVVGGIGSNLMMNYTAIGDTVNLARRIEEAAASGTILVSEIVYRQTHRLFDMNPVTVLNPKGITRPVPAYRVTGLRAQPGLARGVEGLRAPMIGRDRELARLEQRLAALAHRSQGQFVLVTGEAGIGKSRLTAELKASLEQHSIRLLEGQSLAYRRSIAFWIFIDLLNNYLGVNPNTPQAQTRERLTQLTYQTLGSPAGEAIPYLEHLLNLPYSSPEAAERLRYLDAGQLRQQIFLALRDLLAAEAHRRPLLLILEDLHWADDASLELLRFLLETVRQAPIFILGISRQVLPGPMSKAIEWAQQSLGDRFETIQLQSLSFGESEQLLARLLTLTSVPEKLREQILQRAAGVPFYLEEILRMLIDEGAIHRDDGHWRLEAGAEAAILGVPATLQGLILTRFDRLGSPQRRVLQVASVIGTDFSLRVLEEVVGPAEAGDIQQILLSLVEREFLLLRPAGEDPEYSFRHILMSDAIYSTLLRRERSKLHGQVGDAIEKLHSDRLEGQVELLANHYRWSPRLDRALHYLILAGQKAARSNVNDQARQHYEAALELLPQIKHLPYQELQVEMGLADALVFLGDYPAARLHYQAALQAIAGQDAALYAEERATLRRKIAKTFERQGEYDQALAHLTEAQQDLDCETLPLPVERAQILSDVGWIHFRRGGFVEAQQHLQQALGLVEATDAYDAIASIYNRLGGVAYNQGDWNLAASYLRKSIALREAIHDAVGLAISFSNLGYLNIEMGEFDNALENLTRSYELNTRLGQVEGIALSLNNLGWLQIERGEMDKAQKALQHALELARQIGYSSLLRQILKNIGELHLAAGEWDQAREVLCETTASLEELGANDQLLDTYRLLGEAALGAGDMGAAGEWSQKAHQLFESLGNQTEEVSAVQRGELYRFWGRLAMQQREWEQAAASLRESESIFAKLRSRLYQGRVAYQLGALAEARRDRRSAQLRYREAALLFQSIGARLEESRAEQARRKV
ncbi:MAG TPA: tetratricopeptide repeat protein [Anaerolineales bacterium]